VTGGSWKLISVPESEKYLVSAATDGGVGLGQFEFGNNLSLVPFRDLLSGWWKFEDGNGTTTIDSSGWGRNGTWNGANSASGTHFNLGKVGSFSGSFDGSTNWVSVPSITTSGSAVKYTLSAWVKPTTSWPADRDIIMGGSFNEWQYFSIKSNKFRHNTYNGSTFANEYTFYPSLDEWIFLAATYDLPANRSVLYINGVPVSTISSGLITTGINSNVSAIGSHKDGGAAGAKFIGLIDDVRIYNRALSAAEVSALYNATR
jgi:hypothetical protein